MEGLARGGPSFAGELSAEAGLLGRGGYLFWAGPRRHGARRQADFFNTNLLLGPKTRDNSAPMGQDFRLTVHDLGQSFSFYDRPRPLGSASPWPAWHRLSLHHGNVVLGQKT